MEAEGSGGCGSYSDDEDCNYYEDEDDYYYNYDEGSGSGEPEPPKTTSKPPKEDEAENWPPWVTTAQPEHSNKDITVEETQYPRTADQPLKPKEPSFSGVPIPYGVPKILLLTTVLIFILL